MQIFKDIQKQVENSNTNDTASRFLSILVPLNVHYTCPSTVVTTFCSYISMARLSQLKNQGWSIK